jgi:hypothetical protein
LYTSSQNFNLNQIPDESNTLWWDAVGGNVGGVLAGEDIVITGLANFPVINVSSGPRRFAAIIDLPIPTASTAWQATYTALFDGPLVASKTLFCFRLFMYIDVPKGGSSFNVNWAAGVDRILVEVYKSSGGPMVPEFVTSTTYVVVGNGLLPLFGDPAVNATSSWTTYDACVQVDALAGTYELRATVMNRSRALAYPTGAPLAPGGWVQFTAAMCTVVPLAG